MGLSAVIGPQSASAAVGPGEDRQLTSPTGWYTYTGLTVAQISSTLTSNSARLTDLQLDQATGTYTVTLLIGPPQAARHIEYSKVWLKPHRVTMTFHWKKPA